MYCNNYIIFIKIYLKLSKLYSSDDQVGSNEPTNEFGVATIISYPDKENNGFFNYRGAICSN